MILYSLKCRKDHQFEAWFRDSALYERQVAAGELRCPVCGSKKVEKALMAPNVMAGRSHGRREAGETAGPGAGGSSAVRSSAGGASGEAPSAVDSSKTPNAEALEMRKALLELRRQIEDNFDYVGTGFAEEARKIHYGEIERRSIYGETSEEDAEALREEGIAVRQVPWVPRGDS